VNHADLYRIKGVGAEFAELLEAAGVDSVPELAQRSPTNLQKRMEEVNEQKKLTRRVPSESQVTAWVAEAKTLPRVVTH
jgi:predicted flap endonuclease-1-like 5' DNA nuclease